MLHALMNKSVLSSSEQRLKKKYHIFGFVENLNIQSEIFSVVALTGAHTTPFVAYFANIVECEQDKKITKYSQLRKCVFWNFVFLADAVIISKAA